MKTRCVLGAGLLFALAPTAAPGQVHQVVFELELDDPRNSSEVDTCVAASTKRVIVASNQRITLLDLVDNPRGQEIDHVWAQDAQGQVSSFPDEYLFKNTVSGWFWRDPRVEYDPIEGRFWITIFDINDDVTTGRRLHVAVSRDDQPDTFDPYDATTGTGDWYVYTGCSATGCAGSAAEAHGDAFHLADSSIPAALQFIGIPDHQVINIDDDHLWMICQDRCSIFCATGEFRLRGARVSIPLRHGTGLSIMNGDRPSEAVFGIVQLEDLDPEDPTTLHYDVQEPFDQFDAAQFSINIAEKPTEPAGLPDRFRKAIRLGATRWVSGTLVHEWKDLPITAASDHYFTDASKDPGTPVQDWNIRDLGSVFDSGVLFRVGTEWRILAAHHVGVAAAGPTQTDVTEFRWYLIDPDLDNFPGTTTNPWLPQIVEDSSSNQIIGRAPTGSVTDPHTYQGAIAVNSDDVAYITFTRSGSSSANGWPSLVRARLTADYSAIQYEVNAGFQAGPAQALSDGSAFVGWLGWGYADMQPTHCGFWAVGTLVACNDCMASPAPATSDTRAIWLTEILACNGFAEMNGDGTVDAADLALFLDHYAKQTPQADMDGDKSVDSIDYLIYSDEYAKR